MNQEQELKTRIEQTDSNLSFYSFYGDRLLKQGVQKEELFRRLDVLLDKRLSLTEELKG